MEFKVLGQLEVTADRGVVPVAGQRQQRILAMMLVNPDRPAPLDFLINAIWDDPPATAKRQVQNCLSDLRRQLATESPSEVIVARGVGYQVALDGHRLDLLDFRRLVADAERLRTSGNDAAAVGELRRALDLWRGPALAGLTGRLIEATAASLEETRLTALEQCAELELGLGRHAALVAGLVELVATHPLRERLVGQLMLALYRSGRKAEALAAYRRLHTRLADELGLDPGAALRDLHTAILQDRAEIAGPPAPAPHPAGPTNGSTAGAPDRGPAPAVAVPAQLPADVAHFTGRDAALDQLDAALGVAGGGPAATAVPIAVLTGTAGVGKTALAVHWAHRARSHFPDGQLYVDLRGFSPGRPLAPMEVLGRFLNALRGTPQPVPAELDQAAESYRTALADRRVLIVLDNAGDVDQVRPLLPGNPGCAVLVTSRSRLGGLVARNGAQRVPLDPLADDEAYTLLQRLIGRDRVAAEPDATRELAELSARIPLALRITAANLTDRPWDGIARQVTKLRSGDRLAALAVSGDDDSAVRNTFDLSYQGLDPDGRRLFRLLGLVPGRDASTAAAAALCDLALPHAETLLEQVTGAHLLQEELPGRYAFHDLLRLYAADRASAEQPEPDRSTAIGRLADWYLHATDAAARAAYPELLRLPPPADAPASRWVLPEFANPASGLAWLDAERANLVSMVLHLAGHGARPQAWQLADLLRGYFWRSMHTVEWTTVGQAALAAAEAEGDAQAQCAANLSVADVLMRQSRYGEAIERYQQVLSLAEQSQWLAAQVTAGTCVGIAYRQIGRSVEAEQHLLRTLPLARQLNQPYQEAVLLGYLGQTYRNLDRIDDSMAMLTEAERLFTKHGFPHGAAVTWVAIGDNCRRQGLLDEADDHLQRALAGLREAGDRGGEGQVLLCLGNVALDRGELVLAAEQATAGRDLAEQTNDRQGYADACNLLASIHHASGRPQLAIEEYQRAAALSGETRDRITGVEAQLGLAEVYASQGSRSLAVSHAREALAVAREDGYPQLERRARDLLR